MQPPPLHAFLADKHLPYSQQLHSTLLSSASLLKDATAGAIQLTPINTCVCPAGADAIELQAPPLAGFSSHSGELGVPLAVTMVFCCVEGGAARVHRRPEVARLLHSTLSRLMQVRTTHCCG
jgi:hypothetical protein